MVAGEERQQAFLQAAGWEATSQVQFLSFFIFLSWRTQPSVLKALLTTHFKCENKHQCHYCWFNILIYFDVYCDTKAMTPIGL